MEQIKIPDSENVWEAVLIITGQTFIFHNGFKEEADIKNVFRFDPDYDKSGNIIYQFSRFDFHPAKPAANSMLRMNRSVIILAWYIDPASDIVTKLKAAIVQMDAKRAGIIIPGA
jgi:hypothetical protein